MALNKTRGYSPVDEQSKDKPANTAKFSAYVQQRRSQMEKKKKEEQEKFQEEVQRFMKMNRLSQRVKCSPALVSTT